MVEEQILELFFSNVGKKIKPSKGGGSCACSELNLALSAKAELPYDLNYKSTKLVFL